MNKVQLTRWNAAKKLFEKLIAFSELSGYIIEYDEIKITSDQIIITDDEITVKINYCYYTQFSCDPEFDEGMHMKKSEFEKYVREHFKLVQYIKW